MTWFSFSAKSLSILVVLPLILSKFSKTEIALWYLFNILFGFQIIADLGFGSTFSRVISYAMAGLKSLEDIGKNKRDLSKDGVPNWGLILALNKKMNSIFLFIAIIFISLISLVSLWFLDKPIENLEDPSLGYYLLALILSILFLKVYSRRYISFISGVNEVALLRRWEGFIIYCQIISSILVLILFENFFLLVLNNQFWVLVGIVNTYLLQKRILKKHLKNLQYNLVHIEKKSFLLQVFSPAWKSGLGTLSSYGLNQFSSLVLVDFLVEDDLVVYLISFRFITIISEFSRAPFYAKLPYFGQQYQSNTRGNLLKIVKRSIDLSIAIAVICLVFVTVLGNFSLELIQSNVKNLDYTLWFLLSINIVLERLGAMHFQLHSLSNKVVWHKANIIYGLIFIAISIATINQLGLYSIPVAMLAGNIFYYTTKALITSYKEYSYNPIKFNSIIIVCVIILTIINIPFLIK